MYIFFIYVFANYQNSVFNKISDIQNIILDLSFSDIQNIILDLSISDIQNIILDLSIFSAYVMGYSGGKKHNKMGKRVLHKE